MACSLQVQQIQEAAATLIVAYSGEKAREIQNHEMEVVNAWRNLQLRVEGRRMQLSNSTDLYRFFSMARDLLNWMTDLSRQMDSHEKPRSVTIQTSDIFTIKWVLLLLHCGTSQDLVLVGAQPHLPLFHSLLPFTLPTLLSLPFCPGLSFLL